MLTVQIGQCGNQLGGALFQKLADETDPQQSHQSAFFRKSASHASDRSLVASQASSTARAVLIDMEPKVIQQCLQASASRAAAAPAAARQRTATTTPGLEWKYESSNTYTRQSGSGNNWAYGYNGHGAQNQTELLDLIQTVRARL